MVLESLVNPELARRKPHDMFFFGVFTASIGLFLSYWVFRQFSSLIMVFLITLASVPFLYFTLKSEESIDLQFLDEKTILKKHSRVLYSLMLLFLGTTFSLSVWYVLLPTEMVTVLFSSQSQTIVEINNQITGGVASLGIVARIFLNNIRVLVFSVIFAFLYGVGALFILTWNATVIAAAIGNFVRRNVASSAGAVGLEKVSAYFSVFSFGILRYIIHGIPEILAYFVGGLAGGIISMAIINHDLFHAHREQIMYDAAELILIAVGLLFVASILEVYVTPILF